MFTEPLHKSLPLLGKWLIGVENIVGAVRSGACKRCQSSEKYDYTALPPVGDPGGVLLVAYAPTVQEASDGRGFSGVLYSTILSDARKLFSGPVAATYSLGCPAPSSIHVCRDYLVSDIAMLAPRRMIVIGEAVRVVTGLYLDTTYIRRGWAVVKGVPTFFLQDPRLGMHNRFMAKSFRSSLKWALTCKIPKLVDGTVSVLTTGSELEEYLAKLTFDPLVIDVEHTGHLWDAEFGVLCVGFCQDVSNPVVATVSAVMGARDEVARVLADVRYPKIGHNIKHDRHALYRLLGEDMVGISADTMLWSQLKEAESPAGLGKLAWTVGMGGYKEAARDLVEDDESRKSFGNIPPNDLHVYNGRDTSVTLQVYKAQESKMGALCRTWRNLVGPAFEALAIVERNGIMLSAEAVGVYDFWLKAREDILVQSLAKYSQIPVGFNRCSPLQMRHLLFDILKVVSNKKTKTGVLSADRGVMEEASKQHPCIKVLCELAVIGKQRSTYGLSILKHISPVDDRVHTTFKIVRTGRLSSSNPNLQNVTRGEVSGDEGEWARGCYVAPSGSKIVNLDFSQLELRTAAMLSGDTAMSRAFQSGVDFHTSTAALMYGVPIDKVEKSQRSAAKCYHPDTEVLTKFGWKKILDLAQDEAVMQATPSDGFISAMSWVIPTRVFSVKHASGELVHLKNEGMDLRVTSDHRMLGWRATGEPYVCAPEDMNKARGWGNAGFAEGDWEPDDRLLRLAVATQADGAVTEDDAIRFEFAKKRKIDRMAKLLCGIPHMRGVSSSGTTWFHICVEGALPVLGLLDNKELPWRWLGLAVRSREIILGEARHWGSCQMRNWRMYCYSSVSKKSVDVLQAIAAITGSKTRAVWHQGENANHNDLYALTIRDRSWSRGGSLEIITEKYSGVVACLSVPSSYVLVRDCGVPVICGQCLNFGLLYGQTPYAVSKDLNISYEEAKKMFEKLFGAFPALAAWRSRQVADAETSGEVWAAWDPPGERLGWVFRRSAYKIGETGTGVEARKIHNHWCNVALNTPIQCIANCFALDAIIEVVRWTREECPEVRLIMTVHDSLMLEVPDSYVNDAAREVRRIMTSRYTGGVPLVVDTEVGQNWGQLKKLKI